MCTFDCVYPHAGRANDMLDNYPYFIVGCHCLSYTYSWRENNGDFQPEFDFRVAINGQFTLYRIALGRALRLITMFL